MNDFEVLDEIEKAKSERNNLHYDVKKYADSIITEIKRDGIEIPSYNEDDKKYTTGEYPNLIKLSDVISISEFIKSKGYDSSIYEIRIRVVSDKIMKLLNEDFYYRTGNKNEELLNADEIQVEYNGINFVYVKQYDDKKDNRSIFKKILDKFFNKK